MKTRQGFVGNSSTSSFLIFGANLENVPAEQRSRIKSAHVNVTHGQDDVYIGLSWDAVEDDETGRGFKQRVADDAVAALTAAGVDEEIIKDLKFETYSEAWND